MLERVVSNQAATISRLTTDQEKARITKDSIHGKLPEKTASAARSGGYVLVLAPFVLVPVSQSLSPEPSITTHSPAPLQTIHPRHTTAATDITTQPVALEGMTLDAPIRPLHRVL
jgi:hypothetical protein